MKALIDGDIFLYEIGFGCEVGWGGNSPPPFQYVQDLLHGRINEILVHTMADEYEIFLSCGGNFRNEVAVTKGYKANRKDKKPFHYENIKAHLIGAYNATQVYDMEADDMMGIRQMQFLNCGKESIICSRDKDLKMIPGNHFSWELGKQPSFGPEWVDEDGWLKKEKGKVKGVGFKFFCFQMLTGDTVDNIPGLPSIGPVKAFSILNGYNHQGELWKRVEKEYERKGMSYDYLLEQANLLWICQDIQNGVPVKWSDYESL